MGMKLKNGLTPKQNKIVQLATKQIVETGATNQTKIGMQVFNTNTPETARVMVSQELQKPTIKEALDRALEAQGITTEVITGNLGYFANAKPENVSADAAIKANVELLKLMGAYPGVKSAHLNINLKGKISNKSYQEVKDELTQIDQELSTIIDGNVDNLSTPPDDK